MEVEEWVEFGDFWERIFIKARQENELELFCVSLWMIWNNRYKIFHEDITSFPQLLADKARKLVDSFYDILD